MYINFSEIADSSRIWVYQADRTLNNTDIQTIKTFLIPKLEGWAAHQQPLLASFTVLENRFVVVAVDENESLPSGCSIDKSTHWLRELGTILHIDFFDRSMAFLDKNETLQTVQITEVKQVILEGKVSPNTLIYNNLVKIKIDLKNNFKIKAADAWLKRFFKTEMA